MAAERSEKEEGEGESGRFSEELASSGRCLASSAHTRPMYIGQCESRFQSLSLAGNRHSFIERFVVRLVRRAET